jgi:hypothetical protein
MIERFAGTGGIVDQHARNPRQCHCDAAHREGLKPCAEPAELILTDGVAQGPAHDEEAIDVLGSCQLVDDVALGREALRRAQNAASEADEMSPVLAGGICRPRENRVLVVVLEPVNQ